MVNKETGNKKRQERGNGSDCSGICYIIRVLSAKQSTFITRLNLLFAKNTPCLDVPHAASGRLIVAKLLKFELRGTLRGRFFFDKADVVKVRQKLS